MLGLPETFDMAKRLGLILYFPLNTDREKSFNDIFLKYSSDFDWIQNDFKRYRSDCFNPWSQNKCRLGQPQISSKTSFSKYMRVAHGMNLISMEKKHDSWNIETTDLTHVVNILKNADQKYKFSFFELNTKLKFFMFKNLLNLDGIFLLPILKSLDETDVSSSTGFLNKEFLTVCSINLSENFLNTLNTEHLKPQEARIQIKRLNFFEENRKRLESNQEPTRGFLHLIEPRVHWLIDLLLMDHLSFCQEGRIKPAKFLLNSFNFSKKDQELLIKKYFEYLMDLQIEKTLNKEEYQRNLDNTIEYAIGELKKYYSRLIPLDTIVILIQTIGSTNSGIFIPSDEILIRLKEKYSILRDWNADEGFLDVNFSKSISQS